MNLVIVGSVGLDDVKTPFGEVKSSPGGSALYASVAASYFAKAGIVGVIGNDFPEEAKQSLIEKDINLDGLKTTEGKTFRWGGVYDDLNTAETAFTDLNVFADFKPVLPESYKSAEFALLGNIDPDLQIDVLNQLNEKTFVAGDTMNFWITGKRDALSDVIKEIDILFINEEEAKIFSGKKNVFLAADYLLEFGLKALVIKQGAYGAAGFYNNKIFSVPVYPLKKVVDPTGAGDSFAGSFMGFLVANGGLTEDNFKKAMLLGTAVASFNIESFSFEKTLGLSEKDIEDRFLKLKQMMTF
ncbi:MAG: sugar kinase [Candidatus Cloacimonadota bacterium]|nr:MAG: sugar kinase [Candidatus Cloacimonadota bacterium]